MDTEISLSKTINPILPGHWLKTKIIVDKLSATCSTVQPKNRISLQLNSKTTHKFTKRMTKCLLLSQRQSHNFQNNLSHNNNLTNWLIWCHKQRRQESWGWICWKIHLILMKISSYLLRRIWVRLRSRFWNNNKK